MDKFLGCIKKTLIFNFEKECITYLISKSLSTFIILSSFTNKLPQILYMYKMKEIIGLSFISIYLDILVTLFSALYPFHMGYPFLSYGECVIIFIQNLIVFFLAWKYDKNKSSNINNISFTIILFSFLFLCYMQILDEKSWKLVASSTAVLSTGSKISQILKSCKAKSTGPLSTLTFAMNMVGNLARIFTTIKETKDLILITRYFLSLTLNSTIFLLIIYYNWDKKEKKDDEKDNSIKENKDANNVREKNNKKD